MYKRVLLLGDSQTQRGASPHGWVNLIGEQFVRRVDITNRGLSGYNTRWVLQNICKVIPALPAYHYDMAVVWFGSNDATKPGLSQHVSEEDYHNNLTQITCKLITCMGIQPDNVLVLTPPCIDEEMLEYTFPGKGRTNTRMRRYADIALSVAQQRQCQSADLFAQFQDHLAQGLFTDGLHLSERGNELVAGVVGSFLERRVQAGMCIPDWKDLQ